MRLKDHVYVLTTMLIILIWCFSVNWSKLQEAAKRLCNMKLVILIPEDYFGLPKMRLKDCVYVLTTVLIILIWYFFINWSKLQEVAKQSCNVHDEVSDFVTNCDNPGLFKSHFGCCPHKHCPVNHFPFHLHSGVANVVAAKICFNNTIIMGGIRNNAGEGLNIVIANGDTGKVLRNKNFNLESRDPQELLAYLKTLKPGNIVLVASYIDPTTKLTDEIRDIFSALGSTMVKSLKPRDSWVFAGAYGIKEARPFEKLIQNDMRNNAYEDWPEMGEVIGCFPRISENE
ncbi:protein FAM3D-like [Sinocyclocheilus rhinocerous]|uniref:protein FAM3D-like n=1 Tax=Sinocyclocheilus rhinocerous TaxID=307959 RepID=UPI0007B7BA0B|nr:PREDICTED: protein FAM3D-like [Sinocyclocheilus rhinocerous]